MKLVLYGCGCNQKFGYSKWNVLQFYKKCFQISKSRNIASSYYSTMRHERNVDADPYKITRSNIDTLHNDIKKLLSTKISKLQDCSQYYFDNEGKLFRPMTIMLMAKACNYHKSNNSSLALSQHRMAMISEMIHTSSLLHDDVIDDATMRRNKLSVNQVFSPKEAVLAGDYILSKAAILLAQLGNTETVTHFANIINDLVKGELMQLVAKENIDERFNHYISKTFKKTASLIAYSCKSVALLGDLPPEIQDGAFNYGKNIGICFQLVDDALDFTVSSEAMGKDTSADLSLGLATAPVLLASQKFPDLHGLIGRKFKEKEDVQTAIDYVNKSDGVEETFMLAQKHADQAIKDISPLAPSIEKDALINLTKFVIERKR